MCLITNDLCLCMEKVLRRAILTCLFLYVYKIYIFNHFYNVFFVKIRYES